MNRPCEDCSDEQLKYFKICSIVCNHYFIFQELIDRLEVGL